MIVKADILVKEVEPPPNDWCASGHSSRGTFKRGGPTSVAEPIKFFQYTVGNKTDIYCEPCLILTNWLAKQKKNSLKK